jgi:hypothetical protein
MGCVLISQSRFALHCSDAHALAASRLHVRHLGRRSTGHRPRTARRSERGWQCQHSHEHWHNGAATGMRIYTHLRCQ